jgi:glycosyltransferase involved in cell wall biosynthesis
VAIPCLNEEKTVGKVVADFRAALPEAEIVVYDNGSTDKTSERAAEAGARVATVSQPGKGNVVKGIFESSDADVVLMVDGDDTYEALDAMLLIGPVLRGAADMTIGTRLHTGRSAFRSLHFLGNRLMTGLLNALFHSRFEDILSGYRAFSRRFIGHIPLLGRGFEIETELMLQALEHGMTVREIPIRFRNRPDGSESKLGTFKDGYRILLTIVSMLRDHRPLFLFSVAAFVSLSVGGAAWAFNREAAGIRLAVSLVGLFMMKLSIVLFLAGLILNTINVRMGEIASLLKRRNS